MFHGMRFSCTVVRSSIFEQLAQRSTARAPLRQRGRIVCGRQCRNTGTATLVPQVGLHSGHTAQQYSLALKDSAKIDEGSLASCFDEKHLKDITNRFVVKSGGKKDDTDANIIETAQRECMEEIGIYPRDILGMWHDVPNKNFTTAVTPVIAFLGKVDTTALAVNHDEVAEVFTMPMAVLMDPENRTTRLRTADGATQSPPPPLMIKILYRLISHIVFRGKPMPAFKGADHLVWGLTAYVLNGVLNTAVYPTANN